MLARNARCRVGHAARAAKDAHADTAAHANTQQPAATVIDATLSSTRRWPPSRWAAPG